MDDVADSRGREATLPGHSGGVACSNVNMTSVDSGVETENDSNDSSTVQLEGHQVAASQVVGDAGTTFKTLISHLLDQDESFGGSMYEPSLLLHDNTNRIIPNHEFFRLFHRVPSRRKLSEESNYYRSKMKALRHKDNFPFEIALRDWHMERMYRKMRLAATMNNVDLMKIILDHGISPNNQDMHGRTPLHISACRGYTEIVGLLLKHGANPNQRDCIGNTPLHLATINSRLSVVTQLLTAGTDVLALDLYGYNPLQLAKAKLKMLQRNWTNDEDMLKVKKEMHDVIKMLLGYLHLKKNMEEEVETLSDFCSRLSLSNTSDQIQDDVKNLLANINTLSING